MGTAKTESQALASSVSIDGVPHFHKAAMNITAAQ